MSWRRYVDPLIKNHLELQVKESSRHRRAYSRSKNPSNAQLWIAIANLSKQIIDLNLKIKFLEGALKDVASKKPSQKSKPKTSKKLKKVKKSKKKSLKKSLKRY